MNLALATGPLAQAVGWALLHVLWQGALVAAALAAALALVPRRNANLRYALSCAALALVVVLAVATGARSYDSNPTLTSSPALATSVLATATTQSVDELAVTIAPDRLGALARAASDALPWLVTLWLLGVSTFSTRLVLEWLTARRLVARGAVPAAESWQAATRRLSRALGVRRVVRLLDSTAVVVPSVIGVLRPAILLPASTVAGLTPAQLEMILAHELAHIRRHDFAVNLLQAVVETLLFYHPAVWWISRQVREERENCCDDLAVAVCGNPLEYAHALTRLEELRADALPLAASANGGTLLARIRRIAGGSPRDRGLAWRGAAALSALSCVLVALVVLVVPALGERSTPGAAALVGAPTEAPLAPAARVAVASPAAVAPDAPVNEDVTSAEAAPTEDLQGSSDLEPLDDLNAKQEAPRDDSGKPTLDELIAMRVHGVTPDRIREVRQLFPETSLEDIVAMSAVGATPEYVRTMRGAGIEVRTAQAAVGLAALGVTPAYVREMNSVGLQVDEAEEAQGLAAMGVRADYVREIRAAGIAVKTSEQVNALAAVGVTADYVKRMRRAGVEITTFEEAQSLKALGVTPEFVERLARAGYANLSVEQLNRLAAAGLTGDFIEEMSKYRSK